MKNIFINVYTHDDKCTECSYGQFKKFEPLANFDKHDWGRGGNTINFCI